MTDARCRRTLEDLVADRDPGVVPLEDQSHLRSLARREGLTGLVGSRIAEERIALSDEIAEGILLDWSDGRKLRALLDLELTRIARALRETHAPLSEPIVLKGPAVARLYPDPTERLYTDIDLLVPEPELPRWGRLLNDCGFRAASPWEERTSRRYLHEVVYRRSVGTRPLSCGLHRFLFLGGRGRSVSHRVLLDETEPGPDPGVSWLRPGALLVALALHYVHHARPARRLSWIRDFIEIGGPDRVERARKLARGWGVGWALERALFDAERVLGRAVWGARPEKPGQFTMAWAQEQGEQGFLYHLALMRELGAAESSRYLSSRLDPRRFLDWSGSFDVGAFREWTARLRRWARETPWGRLFGR